MNKTKALIERVKELDEHVSKPWMFSKNPMAKKCETYIAYSVWHKVIHDGEPSETGIPGSVDVPKEVARLMTDYRTSAPKLARMLAVAVDRLEQLGKGHGFPGARAESALKEIEAIAGEIDGIPNKAVETFLEEIGDKPARNKDNV